MNVVKVFRHGNCLVALSVAGIVGLLANHVQAVNRYFDVNDTAAGSGVMDGGSYSWEGNFWNTAPDTNGTGATTAWTEGDFPRFSAGTDAAGKTYTVTASANHSFAGMFANTNAGGTVHVTTSGGAVLSITSGLQGLFSGTNSNLYLDTAIGGDDATSALQWSGGGGSAYLYGANTFQGGIMLNSANGLNFNNSQSFGTGPITYTTINTAVLANPDVGNFTIANPLTMPAQTTVNKTMIYTGVAPVTFTNWTLGDSPAGFPTVSNVLTVGNNPFPSAKLIINNLAGTANSNLTVSSPAGVNGTLVLTGTSTYGGAFNGGTTIIGTNTTGNPALQADEGAGLPTDSFLLLNGGVLQTSGTFNRPLAASFGQNMAWNVGGGGFSAIGSQLTVDIGGAGAQLLWGDDTATTGNVDLGSKILGPLKFGSVGSDAKTLFVDPIDLNPTGVASPIRTVTVTAGAGGDFTEMSGEISSSNDPVGSPAALTKNGTGTLILSADNTYSGATSVAAGTLLINGTQTGGGLTTVEAGATLGGTGTLGGALASNGTVSPGASVGTLNVNGDVTMNADSHYAVELSGAAADMLAITGNLDLTALDNFLDVTGAGTGSSWVIATYTGTLMGSFETITPGYSVDYGSGTNSEVTLMAAAGLPGDFNNDGKVDAGDYVTWRKNNGTNNALPNDNGLGVPITSAHYDLWRTNFGSAAPGSGSGPAVNGTAVPEPSSIALLLLALAALAGQFGER